MIFRRSFAISIVSSIIDSIIIIIIIIGLSLSLLLLLVLVVVVVVVVAAAAAVVVLVLVVFALLLRHGRAALIQHTRHVGDPVEEVLTHIYIYIYREREVYDY